MKEFNVKKKIRLERRSSYDLLIVRDFLPSETAVIHRTIAKVAKERIIKTDHPDLLLIIGGDDWIFDLLRPFYLNQGRALDESVLGQCFETDLGPRLFLIDGQIKSWIGELWAAIAFGDSILNASENYLKVFTSESFPWWGQKFKGKNNRPFAVGGAFIPDDAEFCPYTERSQVQKISNDFSLAQLYPLALATKLSMPFIFSYDTDKEKQSEEKKKLLHSMLY